MRVLTSVLASLLSLGVVAGAQDTLDPSRFAASLRALADRVSTASSSDAVEINKTVPGVWAVEHQSRRYEVPAIWLRSALREGAGDDAAWPRRRAEIVGRLTALAREADELGRVTAPAAADARPALERILADPEFAGIRTQSALQRVWDAATEWITGLLQRLGLGRVAGAATAEAIAWTLSLVALAGLSAWLISVLRRSSVRTPLPSGLPLAERLGAAAWAGRAAATADVREAVRCAYRAATCRLEEEGVWRVDAARTPREYIRLLPADHQRRPAVADVARRFEEIWYGARGGTDDDRRTILGRLKELECLPAD